MLNPVENEGLKRAADLSSLLSHPNEMVWELIFESLPDMVALIDTQNRLLKANKAMLNFLGVSEVALWGKKCFHFMHNRNCALDKCPHIRMMNDRQVHSEEFFEPKFNVHLQVTTTPVFSDAGELLGSVHIARDITVQKLYAAKLEEFNRELTELNQDKDRFFNIVAHDLRSPFQGVLGFSDMILDNYHELDSEEVIKYIKLIRGSSYSAFVMLENLLSWSRLQTGRMNFRPETVDLFPEINRVESLLNSNALQKSITIHNAVSPDQKVKADRQMLFSILLNLLSNAIKFSFPNSPVSVTAETISQTTAPDGAEIPEPKPFVRISITDMGIGMSSDKLQSLLEKKEQSSARGTADESGAGIGLVIIREMLEKHGSPLEVASEPGKGSTFSFILPTG